MTVEKDWLKESQDILKKGIYDELNTTKVMTDRVCRMTKSLLNIIEYIKICRELPPPQEDEYA